jgi:cellulose synthase (UDP-forming)
VQYFSLLIPYFYQKSEYILNNKIMSYLPHLPQAPTDQEKYLYTKRHAIFFSIYGLFALGCTLTAMLYWIGVNELHLFYIPYMITYAIYIGYTFTVGLFAKDFNIKKHQEIVEQYKFENVKGNSASVDIYLPVCGEAVEVINNAMSYIAKLEWNGGLLTKYVLDDKGDPKIEKLCKTHGFEYISRPDKGWMKKAGNMRYAFERTKGDFITIFDADFCPRADFLTELMPYFNKDEKAAIVQSPQFFHTFKEQNSIQKGFIYKQELFYRLIQPSRDIFGGACCVGTNAIYRREALEPFGGTALIGHSEDMHTGYNCISSGWHIKYISLILAKGVAPDTLSVYYTQQYRWALGNMVLIFSKKFWMAKAPFRIKINYVSSIMYYISFAFGIICNAIPAISMIVFYPYLLSWTHFLLSLPTFFLGFLIQPLWSISSWNISCIGVSESARYSSLFAFWDMCRGKEMPWVSTGDKAKANKLKSFRNFKLIILATSSIIFGFLFFGSLYHLINGDVAIYGHSWYPIMFFSVIYFLISLWTITDRASYESETITFVNWSEILQRNFVRAVPVMTSFIIFCVFLGLTITNSNNDKQVLGVSESKNTLAAVVITTNSSSIISQTSPLSSIGQSSNSSSLLLGSSSQSSAVSVVSSSIISSAIVKPEKTEYTLTTVRGDDLTKLTKKIVQEYIKDNPKEVENTNALENKLYERYYWEYQIVHAGNNFKVPTLEFQK